MRKRQSWQTGMVRMTDLSFQKFRSSSVVLSDPRIRANNTSTPASLGPQKALQKSSELSANSEEWALANLEREVVDACRRAVIINLRLRAGEVDRGFAQGIGEVMDGSELAMGVGRRV